MEHVAIIVAQPLTLLNKSPFRYKLTDNAVRHKSEVLRRHGYDLTRLVAAHPNTKISYGSEFRHPSILHPILKSHQHWNYIKSSLLSGVKTKFKKLKNKEQLKDLREALAHSNHKSTKDRAEDLKKLVKKDVEFGYQLPITKEAALKIPHAYIAPYGIVDQTTINDQGQTIAKLQLTHNQSYKFQLGTSVNSHINLDDLIELTYGKLGFLPEDIGIHSVRSAAAMAMFLANTPIFVIMLVER